MLLLPCHHYWQVLWHDDESFSCIFVGVPIPWRLVFKVLKLIQFYGPFILLLEVATKEFIFILHFSCLFLNWKNFLRYIFLATSEMAGVFLAPITNQRIWASIFNFEKLFFRAKLLWSTFSSYFPSRQLHV